MHRKYPDDEALIAAITAVSGKLTREAFSQLIERCHVSIEYVCRRYKCEYNEVLSELFLGLRKNNWKKLKSWRGDSSLKTWLRTVMINQANDKARKTKRREAVTYENLEIEVSGNVGATLVKAERSSLLLDAIAMLDSEQKYAIMAYHFRGVRLRQIGADLGKTENNVKQILLKARKNLRHMLGGPDFE